MNRRAFLVSAAACLLLAPLVGVATTVVSLSRTELVRMSALIIEATVVANQVIFDQGPSGPVNVRTLTTFEVSETHKGDHQKTVTAVGYGGVVGDRSYNWPGVPRFKVGETVMLFLHRHPAGELTVTGLEQGRMTIEERPGVGKVAIQSMQGLELVGATDRIDTTGEQPLAQLVQSIRAEVEAERAELGKDGGR